MKLRSLVAAIGLGVCCLAASGATPPQAPLVTIRVTSLDAALRDVETITRGLPTPLTRATLLQQLAASFGVEDLSFVDLTQPAAMVVPQGPGGVWDGFVVAVPVKDGARAMDVLAITFPERTRDGDVTVFRSPVPEGDEAATPRVLCAVLRGRILVVGTKVDQVRRFDPASALSGEGLPPGSTAVSLEVEPVASRWKGALSKMREMIAMAASARARGASRTTGDPSADDPPMGVVGGVQEAAAGSPGAPPPPPPPVHPARATAGGVDAPIVVVGDVSPPELTTKVIPEYPEEARRARTEGNVILEAVITRDGDVEAVRVLRSVPGLDQAAIDAVKQWKYKPALKDGRPVKVYFTIVVTYSLGPSGPEEAAFAPPGRGEAAAAPHEPGEAPGAATGLAAGDPAALAAPLAPRFDPSQLAGVFDLYFGLMQDAVDSLSRLQVSLEIADGYVIVHGRGVARDRSSLRAFVDAQRDTGLPAIGRMMPVDAPIIVAGQINWTDPSRAWMKSLMKRWQDASADIVKMAPESDREANDDLIARMNLWSSQSSRFTDCMRGDVALAMDSGTDGMRMLSVQGVADTEACRGVLAASISGARSSAGGRSLFNKEVLEPEKVTTYVFKQKPLRLNGQPEKAEMTIRYAQIGTIVVSGTEPWASKAIREAAAVRDGNVPGGGGLVLTDLGPFTQRPGVFGRIQFGPFFRKAAEAAGTPNDREALEKREELLRTLEGPAGSVPFAMRFDEGAATVEFALPLAMLDALAKSAPKPRPVTYQDKDEGEWDEEIDEP